VVLKSYLREHNWRRQFLISVSAVLILAFFGPFGTFEDLLFPVRLLFWVTAVYGCGVIFWTMFFLVDRYRLFSSFPELIRHVIIVFITSLPGAVLIYYNNLVFRKVAFPFEKLPWLWFTVFSIGMILTSIYFFSHFGKSISKNEKHKQEVAKIQIKTDKNILQFLDRLPKEIGKELVSLSMHDHYIDVVTKQGNAMVHLKFSKAMKELKKYPGVQIHRSHWVSVDAIKSAKIVGRAKLVRLFDGRTLPVSEKYTDEIEKILK